MNPLPFVELFSDGTTDLGGVEFTTDTDIISICENHGEFTLTGNRNNSNSGTRTISQSYNGQDYLLYDYSPANRPVDEVVYDPDFWADTVQVAAGTFAVTYRL